MIDSRAKGARVETQIRDILRIQTRLQWERIPGSGALDPKHQLKGDLYVPGMNNYFCVEAKGYAEDHFTSKLLTGKNPQLLDFWKQAVRQGQQVKKQPLLIFKFDRSKAFVAFSDMPSTSKYRFVYLSIDEHEFYVALLTDWIEHEDPKFAT
jgi:hypothetical protein